MILIRHVLQSIPIYLLLAMCPPKVVIRRMHQIFAKFFWGNIGVERRKHWVSWDVLCLPLEEGGLGFRSLFDINKALMAKLWWKFKNNNWVSLGHVYGQQILQEITSFVCQHYRPGANLALFFGSRELVVIRLNMV